MAKRPGYPIGLLKDVLRAFCVGVLRTFRGRTTGMPGWSAPAQLKEGGRASASGPTGECVCRFRGRVSEVNLPVEGARMLSVPQARPSSTAPRPTAPSPGELDHATFARAISGRSHRRGNQCWSS
eukprot:6513747-Pyramimonas_sp.AAC.1